MPTVFIDLNQTEDVRDVIHRAVEALSAGKIIAFPTETTYGLAASALRPEAVWKLSEVKGRTPSTPFAFALKSYEEALDYVPQMTPMAQRLARRCWPGPVTLVMDVDPQSVVHQLDPAVIESTIPSGTIGLRVPDHDLAHQILRLCAGPIVLTSASLPDGPETINGQQVLQQLDGHVDLVIDGGDTRYKGRSTVVRVDEEFTIQREGVVKESVISELTDFVAVVVCTGNTCRSPMAEGIMKLHFAERLGCSVDEVADHGVTILSAGIAARSGAPAAAQSIEVMRQRGVDISAHTSQPMTQHLAQCCDVIFTLTNGHRQAIVSQWPELQDVVKTLRPDGGDIADPIGAPVSVYQSCAQQIEQCVDHWAKQIDFNQFKK